MTTEKLYVITIPGPGEIFAAPSYKVALLMKEKHDKSIKEILASQHAKGHLGYVSLDDCLAVIEEIDDPEEYAELMKEFSFADWGITEDDLNRKEEESPQIGLFLPEVGAA